MPSNYESTNTAQVSLSCKYYKFVAPSAGNITLDFTITFQGNQLGTPVVKTIITSASGYRTISGRAISGNTCSFTIQSIGSSLVQDVVVLVANKAASGNIVYTINAEHQHSITHTSISNRVHSSSCSLCSYTATMSHVMQALIPILVKTVTATTPKNTIFTVMDLTNCAVLYADIQ